MFLKGLLCFWWTNEKRSVLYIQPDKEMDHIACEPGSSHMFLIHSCIRESLAGSQWCLCDSVTPAPGATSVTPAPCLKHTSQSGDVFSHCVLDLYLPKCPFAQCIDSSCPWAVHFGHTELQLGWGKAAAIRNSLCVYLVPQVTSTSPCGLQALWTDDANV